MQKRLIPAAATVVAFFLSGAAWAQDDEAPSTDTVVATVNGTEITLGHMALARATLPQQYQDLPAEVLFPGILDQLISQTALSQSYEGDVPPRITLALENERRSLIAGEVIESVMADAVTDDLLKAAYDEQYATTSLGAEYNASHILVETEEEAIAIKADLDGGADFAQTAREKSTGPSGPGGGSLGWFGPGMMVPSFEAAVVSLEAGAISDPVQTQFGWHVIILNETRVKEAPKMEDVRAELEQKIRSEAVQAKITELTEAADVDRSAGNALDPNLLNSVDVTK